MLFLFGCRHFLQEMSLLCTANGFRSVTNTCIMIVLREFSSSF